MKKPIIIFDQQCALCRNLAQLAKKRANHQLDFQSLTEFLQIHKDFAAALNASEPMSELGFFDGERLFWGSEAWLGLLEHFPDLAPLNWIAKRLGITQGAAKSLGALGRSARMICPGCGGRVNLKRRRNKS